VFSGIFGDCSMDWFHSIRRWFAGLNGVEQITVVAGLATVGGVLWAIYAHFAPGKAPNSPSQSITGSPATASNGGVAVVAIGNVTIERDPLVAKALEALTQQLEAKERDLAAALQRGKDAQAREQGYQDSIRVLGEAVAAIPKQTTIPNSQVRIKEALEEAAQGNTRLAEAIFLEVEERKAAEGKVANKEAAEAARHRGALAFLHDTEKALQAYRRAVELDPENADGWKQLGHLLHRKGELQAIESTYRKVVELGESSGDRVLLAISYRHLGNVYRIRGELDQAEALYKKALAINETLERKEGMASAYGNLGIVYQTRGELDQAEAMYKKALAINETLGRKEGMASQYGNLGNVYRIRGELDQ